MDSFVAMIMTWRHTSRFSMDNSVHIAHDDETGITDLAQYIIRSPFSLARLNFNHETGMVIYRSKMSHGKNKKTFTVSSAVAFKKPLLENLFQAVPFLKEAGVGSLLWHTGDCSMLLFPAIDLKNGQCVRLQ